MAKMNVAIMIDDLSGKELSDGAGETVLFSLDGTDYEIDLDNKTAERLRSAMRAYTAAGRRTSRTRSPRSTRSRQVRVAPEPSAVRAWAVANGIPISNRGRIPSAVTDQFVAAGN